MEEFRPDELAIFLNDLHRPLDGHPSLMLRCAQESGYAERFAIYFNPFQYEMDARPLAPYLLDKPGVLAVVYPKNHFSARLYQLKRPTTDPQFQYDRTRLLKPVRFHHGFQGIPDNPQLEMAYQQDPAAREQFERALTLCAATALYRALCECTDRLYFMEKGWNKAYCLSPAVRPCYDQEDTSLIHGA